MTLRSFLLFMLSKIDICVMRMGDGGEKIGNGHKYSDYAPK